MNVQFETCAVIPHDHPSLPGHFPGAPIVPGVVILDEIAAALARWRTSCLIVEIIAAKFMHPLQPDQPFSISLTARQQGDQIDFRCCAEERTISEGRLQIRCAA